MQHLNTSPGHENTFMERVTMLARHLIPGTQEWITRKGLFSVLSQAPSAVDFITYFAVVTLIYDHQEHRGHSLPLV